ncbi:hypothetical protein EVAR_90365_1 [Eumeta japonica]|uniref:Uncharacterized protein n=1 Tax=Eumeta variegata TaxID=151549 RepID=A0A4C1YBD4_EUMVA|nr:hypothetical protein EVAR_90365_1 [Eumeta japonica]
MGSSEYETSSGLLPPPSPHSPSIRYPIPTHVAGNELVTTPLRLRVSMGGGDHPLSSDSHTSFPLNNVMKDVADINSNVCPGLNCITFNG